MAIRVQTGGYGKDETPVFKTSYAGCVLETRERNYYDDSDFYAIVWDEAARCIKDVDYATTRAWTYNNGAVVDATPEVLAKARAYQAARIFEAWQAKNIAQAQEPTVGKTVTVVRGRKVPLGTVGVVTWVGKGKRFSASRWATPDVRVGIQLGDGQRVFTSAKNCEVQDYQQYLKNDEDGRAYAARLADGSFVHLVVVPGMAVL